MNGDVYEALTSVPTALILSPAKVGIFLDYEAGEVSFYNVTDGSHLFTFTDSFTKTLPLYFCPGFNDEGENPTPLIICSITTQVGGV